MTALAGVRSSALRDAGLTVGAFILGLVLLTGFLAAANFDVPAALSALWNGAFGSWDALTSATLVRATPLILLGLAFSLASLAGGLNIGMEGQFAAGAIAATWVGLHVGGVPRMIAVPLVMGAGAIAGAIWIAIPVHFRVRFGVTEVISTLLLNFVADAAVSFAVTGPLQEPTRVYPQSAPIAIAGRLPRILPSGRLHLGLILVLAIAGLLALLLHRSSWGFKIKAMGAGPLAARVSGGVAATFVLASALLWSGALAGLGGAIEVSGISYALYQNLSPGYGFTAIAVALLGRLNPVGVVISGFLFGAARGWGGSDAAGCRYSGSCGPGGRGGRDSHHGALQSEADAMDHGLIAGFASATVRVATPLALAAIGESVSERGGVINLGIEGGMLAGAFVAASTAVGVGASGSILLAMLAGMFAAAIFAAIAIGARGDQIITGTAITLGFTGLTGLLARGAWGTAGAGLSIPTMAPIRVPFLSSLPVIGPALFNQSGLTYVMYGLIPLAGWLLYRTRFGLELRACGESPSAASAAGVRVGRVRALGALFGGASAGLAGASLVLAQVGTFTEKMTAGRGFIAIAIVILGRWHPMGVAGAALLFGAATALQYLFQASGSAVPYQLFLALPYLLALAVLAIAVGRARGPAALGKSH